MDPDTDAWPITKVSFGYFQQQLRAFANLDSASSAASLSTEPPARKPAPEENIRSRDISRYFRPTEPNAKTDLTDALPPSSLLLASAPAISRSRDEELLKSLRARLEILTAEIRELKDIERERLNREASYNTLHTVDLEGALNSRCADDATTPAGRTAVEDWIATVEGQDDVDSPPDERSESERYAWLSDSEGDVTPEERSNSESFAWLRDSKVDVTSDERFAWLRASKVDFRTRGYRPQRHIQKTQPRRKKGVPFEGEVFLHLRKVAPKAGKEQAPYPQNMDDEIKQIFKNYKQQSG